VTSRLVLLLPEDGEQLADTIGSLHERQLASEPILVPPGQNVDECVAQILSGAAEQKLDCLRLVILRFRGSVDEGQWNREHEIANIVATACNAGQVRFIRGVVADASVSALNENSFHVGWDFNLIIEPEDSIGEAGFLAAPLGADNGAASAAAGAALVGGLFEFLSEGVLDGWRESSSDNMLRVRLARWHLRIVDVRDLTGEVVDLALNDGSHWHKPDEFSSHPNSEMAMADLANQVSTELRFNYERMGPAGSPPRVKIGIFSAVRLYFRRLSQIMGHVVQAMSDEIRGAFAESVSSLAQGVTFGSDSRVQVVMGQLKGEERLPLGHHWRDEQLRNCDSNLPSPIPDPGSWETLRSVMFGVADGGDFAHAMAGKELSHQEARVVVTNPSVIVEVDPEPFEISDTEAAMLQLDDHTRSVDAYDGVTINILDRAISGASKQLAGDSESDLKSRFRAWTQQHRNCFARHVSNDLGTEGIAAYDDFVRYDLEWDDLENELRLAIEEEQKTRKRIRNLALTQLFLLLSTAVLAYLLKGVGFVKNLFETDKFLWMFEDVSYDPGWGLWLALIAIWLLMLIFLVARLAREQVQAEHRVARVATRPKEVFERRQNSLREFARLSYLSDQFADWVIACSVILHEPHGRTSSTPVQTDWMDDHPLHCLAIGSPSVSQDTKSAAAIAIRKKIVRQGWLSEAFRLQSDRIRRRYSQLMHVPLEQVQFDSDTSTHSDPVTVPGTEEVVLSPRAQLRKELATRRYSEESREELVTSLSDLSPTELSELVDSVQSPVKDLNGRKVHEYVDPLISLDYAPRFATKYGGPSLTPNDMAVEISWAGSTFSKFDINRETKIVVGRDLIAAYRLQLSRPFYCHELMIVGEATSAEGGHRQSVEIDDSDDVA